MGNELDNLNSQMSKVTNFLNFLIIQPQIMTNLTNIEKDKIMAINLLNVKCCKVWSENMEKQIELKCSKEVIKSINDLFEFVEVRKHK